jgi:hypothetical protein
MTERIRKRLSRKNGSDLKTLDISFTPTAEGTDVVATYGTTKSNGDKIEAQVISTKFTEELGMEEQEKVSGAFFLGYTYAQFQIDCPELSAICTGWTGRSKSIVIPNVHIKKN